MSEITLKSSRDGATLSFTLKERRHSQVEFEVAVSTPFFSGRSLVSTYVNGSPSSLFADIAQNWQGWSGAKSWQDLEQRVSLSAKAKSTGHIQVGVEIVGSDYENRLHVVLEFEPNQLDAMAASMRRLFSE